MSVAGEVVARLAGPGLVARLVAFAGRGLGRRVGGGRGGNAADARTVVGRAAV